MEWESTDRADETNKELKSYLGAEGNYKKKKESNYGCSLKNTYLFRLFIGLKNGFDFNFTVTIIA